MNICASQSTSSCQKSSTFTIFTQLSTKAKSMLKYTAACTAFHNLAYSPKSSSWATLVTPPYDTLLAFGATNGAQSASALSLMTSASNTLAKSMLTILSSVSATIIRRLTLTGKANASAASTSNHHTCDLSMPGYVKNALHKFQHPTPKKTQDNPYPATAKQYGVKVQLTDPINTSTPSPFMKSNIYNRSLVPSFFMAMLLTPPFSQHSANSLPTKPLPRKLPNMPVTSFLTIVPPTLVAPFATMPVTWF